MIVLNVQMKGVSRCPHCSIASPLLRCVWSSAEHETGGNHFPITPQDGGELKYWWLYCCSSCGGMIAVKSGIHSTHLGNRYVFEEMYPAPKKAHEDIPETARNYLQQAMDTIHAPDAAAVMAGSAVDAMLKDKGYSEGSLYHRIDQALQDHVLTDGMANWAHEVRLGSNRPRHSDAKRPHVSREEAIQSVEFAEALAHFLYVLTARIQRGTDKARVVSAED